MTSVGEFIIYAKGPRLEYTCPEPKEVVLMDKSAVMSTCRVGGWAASAVAARSIGAKAVCSPPITGTFLLRTQQVNPSSPIPSEKECPVFSLLTKSWTLLHSLLLCDHYRLTRRHDYHHPALLLRHQHLARRLRAQRYALLIPNAHGLCYP